MLAKHRADSQPPTDGQYFTLGDRLFGSFRAPASEDDPLIAVLAAIADKEKLEAELAGAKKAAACSTSSESGEEDVVVLETKKTQ